ncbi:L-fucose:H+ symporter permease [Limosilactobacillus reuteri]|uniref:L-fucose:H+ symporter permease n=1 Tax=Limosilactobacillus reuteri TaxID=1598 RepID=UPI0021D095C9|nr:L-fucose:H+ symporter permease [Limosilactobacillus reuteri]MCU4692046.1 L-fucose:H+ symporter permease [Limosilactobacillus reuteri]
MENEVKKDKGQSWVQLSDGYLSRTPMFQFVILCLIFPLWGAAASLNDILITQFKTVFTLNDTATAFVQSAFYGGYFLMAIPASILIKKTSYKLAILIGLLFYIIGCGMFFPASHVATYSMFLVAIFAIAIGLSFLETSCDTYATMFGPKETANKRLNVANVLIPLGDIMGIVLGKYLIFGEGGNIADKVAKMSKSEAEAYNEHLLQLTLQPYKYILIVLIIIFIVLAVTKMPRAKAFSTGSETKEDQPSLGETFNYLFHNKRYMKGVLCQFIYAGMQTTVWSFTIRLALRLDSHISDAATSTFMIYSYIAWFFGKLVANWFLDRYSITKVLTWFSLLGTISLVITFTVPNITAVIAAIATSFFFGPEWPTIYAHTLDQIHEKKYTETGGAFIVMSLIGGAIVPTIQGRVSDLTGSMQLSFIVPAICFALITIYFWTEHRWEKAHPNEVQEH